MRAPRLLAPPDRPSPDLSHLHHTHTDYHGDPFGPQCMYSASNYANTSAHPPLIGYGADGYPIFGRHLSISAPGYNISLDECGGHSHSGMGDPYITDNRRAHNDHRRTTTRRIL